MGKLQEQALTWCSFSVVFCISVFFFNLVFIVWKCLALVHFCIEQGYVEDTRHEEKQKMTQDSWM